MTSSPDDPRKLIPLEKRGPYSESSGELIAVCMDIAAMRRVPMEANGDAFRVQEQALLRLANAADKLAYTMIEDAEVNSTCHFPNVPQPMLSGLNDSDVFGSFKEAANEADENHETPRSIFTGRPVRSPS